MRIIGRPPENSLDVAIVIPSYAEGRGILQALNGIATQRDINTLNIGIFVVVNNSREEMEAVFAANDETIELLLHLQNGLAPEGLQKKKRFIQKLPFNVLQVVQSEKEAAEATIVSGINITIVDLSTDDHEPEFSNVGLARDTGIQVAREAVKENGIFISTDADASLDSYYVRNAYDLMANQTKYAAASGHVGEFSYVDQPESDRKGQTVVRVERILGSIMAHFTQHTLVMNSRKREVRVLAGSNTVMRRSEYIASGGYQHINGAEDANLGMSLLRQGKKLLITDELTVMADSRVSTRTEKGCGMGQNIEEKRKQYESDDGNFQIKHPASYTMAWMLGETVHAANQRDGLQEEEWKAMVRNYSSEGNFGYMPLTDEEVDIMWNLKQKELTLKSIEENHDLDKYTYTLAEKKWGLLPVDECLAMVEKMLMGEVEGNEVAMKYDKKFQTFIAQEMRFLRLMLRADIKLPKGENLAEGASDEEMRTIINIPKTEAGLREMHRILLMIRLGIMAETLKFEDSTEEDRYRVQQALDLGILDDIDAETLRHILSEVPLVMKKMATLSMQAHYLSRHSSILYGYLPNASDQIKEAASGLATTLNDAERDMKIEWDVERLRVILAKIGLKIVITENLDDLKILENIGELCELLIKNKEDAQMILQQSRAIPFRYEVELSDYWNAAVGYAKKLFNFFTG